MGQGKLSTIHFLGLHWAAATKMSTYLSTQCKMWVVKKLRILVNIVYC